MMTGCFLATVRFGTGWGSTLPIVVTSALTYLKTKRADTASKVS